MGVHILCCHLLLARDMKSLPAVEEGLLRCIKNRSVDTTRSFSAKLYPALTLGGGGGTISFICCAHSSIRPKDHQRGLRGSYRDFSLGRDRFGGDDLSRCEACGM